MHPNKKYAKKLASSKEGKAQIDLLNDYAWELSRIDTPKALEMAEQANLKSGLEKYDRGLANSFRTIAQCYWLYGNYTTAIINIEKALNHFTTIEDEKAEADAINLYGAVYAGIGKTELAVKNYKKALEIRKRIGDKEGVVKSMNSIGDGLIVLKQYEDALQMFEACIEIKHDNVMFGGIVRYNISEVYYHLDRLEESEESVKECLKIGDELSFGLMHVYAKSLKAKIALKRKDVPEAIKWLTEALKTAREINAKDRIYHLLEDLSKAVELNGDIERALEYYKEFHTVKQAVLNEESTQRILSIEHRNEMELAKQETELVLERNLELQKANEQIKQKQDELSSKNKEITDSIRYAQRIQKAVLPTTEELNEFIPTHFVVYHPKDVLSGDFYWAADATNNLGYDLILAAVGDCTGHGVPGALMSIVGNSFLRLAESEPDVNNPGEALDFVNQGVYRTLRQSREESSVQDGMDITFVAIDYGNMNLYSAGAINSVYLVRDNELTEIEGDRHPVGAFLNEPLKKFTNNSTPMQKGDMIYMFTDGFADQFGGPFGKKFKYKAFKRILTECAHLEMDEQKAIINKTFFDWKGSLEQLDDVCIMGIRI